MRGDWMDTHIVKREKKGEWMVGRVKRRSGLYTCGGWWWVKKRGRHSNIITTTASRVEKRGKEETRIGVVCGGKWCQSRRGGGWVDVWGREMAVVCGGLLWHYYLVYTIVAHVVGLACWEVAGAMYYAGLDLSSGRAGINTDVGEEY